MEPVLSEEQRLLRDSARRLAEAGGGVARHRRQRDAAAGFDRDRLAEMAAAGWLSMIAAEESGGLGLGMVDLALVLEQAGRELTMEPVSALACVGWALGRAEAGAATGDALAALADGSRVILPAMSDAGLPAATPTPDGGFRLDGATARVAHAADADAFLVAADADGGTVLCLVAADTDGLAFDAAATVDGGTQAALRLAAVTVAPDQVVARENSGGDLAAGLYDRLLIGQGAEMLGVMDGALATGIEYMKVREQFGRAIGSFQALQHRAVDNHVDVELSRCLLYQVAAAMDGDRASRVMVAAVKARLSEAVLNVTKSVIQMHGAIGFTDEYDAGLYLRRAMTLAAEHGGAGAHRARFATLMDAAAAE